MFRRRISEFSAGIGTIYMATKQESKEGTYPLSFRGEEYSFTEPVPEELLCPVCHEVLYQPRQTPCGHLFCGECLDNAGRLVTQIPVAYQSRRYGRYGHTQKIQKSCPTCRANFDDGGFQDKHTERKINNLEIMCNNRSCEWKGSLCRLADHKAGRAWEGCQYEPVSCTLGCGEEVIRKDLEDHKENTCSLRTVDCKYCQWSGIVKNIETHYTNCLDYPLNCPNNCGETGLPAHSMEDHLQECPEQKTKCPYSTSGCPAMVKRKNLEDHKENSKDQHLELTMTRVGQLSQAVVKLVKVVDELERDRKRSGVHLQGSSTTLLPFAHRPWLENTKLFPSMPWIIRMGEFSKKKAQPGVKWTSDPFFTSPTGYKLQLSVCATGDEEDTEDHMSVYVILLRGPNDATLYSRMSKSINVSLLNQFEDTDHHSCSILVQEASPNESRRETEEEDIMAVQGVLDFISHDELNQECSENRSKYLKDDCLFFKIDSEVVYPAEPVDSYSSDSDGFGL